MLIISGIMQASSLCVSIHAPPEGRDNAQTPGNAGRGGLCVSIHAPPEGRDLLFEAGREMQAMLVRFNPRAPGGARLCVSAGHAGVCWESFNPRAPGGARSSSSRPGGTPINQLVSIHAPPEGRDHIPNGQSIADQLVGFQSTRPRRGAISLG